MSTTATANYGDLYNPATDEIVRPATREESIQWLMARHTVSATPWDDPEPQIVVDGVSMQVIPSHCDEEYIYETGSKIGVIVAVDWMHAVEQFDTMTAGFVERGEWAILADDQGTAFGRRAPSSVTTGRRYIVGQLPDEMV